MCKKVLDHLLDQFTTSGKNELVALKDYIEENLAKDFIPHSKSPPNALILLVEKKAGFLRISVNCRGLNKVTMTNRYTLPFISGLLNQLGETKIYMKIDLQGAYNLVHIKEGDE